MILIQEPKTSATKFVTKLTTLAKKDESHIVNKS